MSAGPGAGSLMFFLSQLGYAGPFLFVYLVAGYFAIIYLDRARLPAMLTLVGVIINLVTTFGGMAATFYAINYHNHSSLPQLLQIISLVSTVMGAIGLGLFVAAIFVGRDHTPPDDRYLRE